MCTTVGFEYAEGVVLGRTLEMGVKLDNHILYVPKNYPNFISTYDAKYAVIGTGFMQLPSLGDGINEMGLMGSNNLLPHYASFSKETFEGKINVTTANAFNFLLSRCKDVAEVRMEAEKINIVKYGETEDDVSIPMHFFFKDSSGNALVLEPKDGKLLTYDNPYGVLTNAPEFPWHVTNLKNYINLQAENIEETDFNGVPITKFGEGSGLVGLPGDFSPPSRFVRSAYFVAKTPKDLARQDAILQAFRILSQADIPTGAVVDPKQGNDDETLYTAVMDTHKKAYFIKHHDNINIQPFYLDDYKEETEIQFIEIEKQMNL